ncbi:MAG: FAD-dependent oxidoreductase [Kiloniellales bacterium]|nr:FAD-dependent oxidoreductase [Kiloniellales bacterium]
MAKKRILVLGGGFAGVYAARALRKRLGWDYEIELVNDVNYFVFQPFLPEVAGGLINSADAVTPLRDLLKGIHFRKAEVRSIDLDSRTVTVVQGTRRRLIPIACDHLVIALGQRVDLGRLPGMNEHAFWVKNLADAHELRNHVIDCLEHADVTTDSEARERLLNFVVVGAGFSGVETVGEIKELIDGVIANYPNIGAEEISVYLVEFAPRILNELPEPLAAYAQQKLEQRGVEVRLGVGTVSATARRLTLTDGSTIRSNTIVATVGNVAHPLVEGLGLELDKGKIVVDRFLRAKGREDVWAVGDVALIPLVDSPSHRDDYAPPTAQFAVREGGHVARNLARGELGGELLPFSYESKGSLASLGGRRAVALLFGLRLSGFIAWLIWKAFYLSFLPGFATRVRVLANWVLAAVLPRNTVQIQQANRPATRYYHFSKDDVVFEPGMIAQGFYVVIEGSFELTIEGDGETGGEPIVKTFGPGDHFGERVILGEGLRTGAVRALEDSIVLIVSRDGFERFASAFPVLREYFENYIPRHFPTRATRVPEEPAT